MFPPQWGGDYVKRNLMVFRQGERWLKDRHILRISWEGMNGLKAYKGGSTVERILQAY